MTLKIDTKFAEKLTRSLENDKKNLVLRWCWARDLFKSQIIVTRGVFQL